jgi:predicted flap endonuclease-1-like 5' DNA nuclease
MSPQTKETFEKAAYTAVGAPIAAVKALNARLADLREMIRESRSEMSEDLAKEFDNWVAEGERVVNMALERVRGSSTAEQARVASQRMRDRVSKTVEEMRAEMDEALDVIEPEESLETIKGVGPGYAERFNKAGVAGISDFLDKTATQDAIRRLADKTDFTTDQISQWREQVDLTRVKGVGDSYIRLLHRADIWTIDQFAEAKATAVASEMKSLDIPGMPDQIPTEEHLSDWISKAKKLATH